MLVAPARSREGFYVDDVANQQVPTVYHRSGGTWSAVPYGAGGLPVACAHPGAKTGYTDLTVHDGVVVITAWPRSRSTVPDWSRPPG